MAKSAHTPRPQVKQSAPSKPLPMLKPLVVVGILFVLVAIFYSGHLFGNAFLWEDFLEQEFPFRTFATTSLAQGVIPHWNPYTFCGMPFLADIQVAFWYPTNMLQALFVSDGHLSPVVMQWFIIMHLLVAGAGMYFLVKKIFKTDDWSALFAAIAYAFSGYMTGQIIHQMIVYQLALFPFVVYFFILGFDSFKYSIAAGLLLGVMYLAGHPQTTLYLSFFLICLGLYEIGFRLRKKNEERVSFFFLLRMVIPPVIAFGIFAIQFFPTQELAVLSRRDVMTYQNSVDGGSMSFGHILTLVLPRLFGVTDAATAAKVPYWNGEYFFSWETMTYIGILPLCFGIIASFAGIKKKYVGFFAGMSLFALLFAMGDHFFLYKIFFSLPLFDKLRTPARMMMVMTFAMCALSGVGLSLILKDEFDRKKKKIFLFVGGIIGAIWLAAVFGLLTPTSFNAKLPAKALEKATESIPWASNLATFPVIFSLVLLAGLYWKKMRGISLVIIVMVVTIIELFMYGMPVNKSFSDPRSEFNQNAEIIRSLKEDQAKELSRANIRIPDAMPFIKRNQGPYDRIQLLDGYNPLVLAEFAPQCANSSMTLDLLNVKWRANKQGLAGAETYLPRAKMYYNIDVRSSADVKNVLKTDSTYDYHAKLLLEEKPTLAIAAADAVPTVQIKRYEPNEIEIAVKTGENGMLFLSEVNYPAWKATVDGKDAKIYKAFTTLRAVEVPKGEHTIIMRYESDAFKTGSMITIVTLILSLGAFGLLSFKKRS